jgi:type III secretory pathway component EscV
MNRRKYSLVPIEDPMEKNSKTKKNEKVRNRIHRFPFSIYVIVAICVIIAGFCFIYKKTPAVNPQNKKTKHDANSTKNNQGIENNKPYRPLPLIEEMDHENCKYQPKNVTQVKIKI